MRLFKVLMLIGAVGAAYHLSHARTGFPALPDGYSPGQFVAAAMPQEASGNTVLIVAPVNCRANAARTQRANALADELTRRGIPNRMSTQISFRVSGPGAVDRTGMKATEAVLEAGPPVVFVNGLGKANPSPDEVAEVYRRTQ